MFKRYKMSSRVEDAIEKVTSETVELERRIAADTKKYTDEAIHAIVKDGSKITRKITNSMHTFSTILKIAGIAFIIALILMIVFFIVWIVLGCFWLFDTSKNK